MKVVFFKMIAMAIAASLLAGCGVANRVGNKMDGNWASGLASNHERARVKLTSDVVLNPDVDGKPLSVVVRIYQLSAASPFTSVSPEQLLSQEDEALGNTLVDQREVTLVPGSNKVDIAPLKPQTRYVGVAAFFRQTQDDQWHALFDAGQLRNDGLLTESRGIEMRLEGNTIKVDRGTDVIGTTQR